MRKIKLDLARLVRIKRLEEIEEIPTTQERKDEMDLARLLGILGYEDALALVDEELKPLAQKEGLTLVEAAFKYANANEEQDTSWYQLHLALVSAPSWVQRAFDRYNQSKNGIGR